MGAVAAKVAGVVVVAGIMASGVSHHHGHGGGGIIAHLTSIGAAHQYTPASWAHALLKAEGLPRTGSNMCAIESWERAEGGHWNNSATFNPINTTQHEPGSSAISGNPDGVQAYTSWHQGLVATVTTLNNGYYGPILAALRAGNSAQAVASAEAATPWGTGPFTVSC